LEATLTKIQQLKQEQGIDLTSEYVLGITEPPEYQCPKIDEVIKDIGSIEKEVDNAKDYLRNEEYDDVQWHLDSVNHDLYGLANEVEEIRTAIEEVRAWGQEWKNLAKRLINETDVKIEDFI